MDPHVLASPAARSTSAQSPSAPSPSVRDTPRPASARGPVALAGCVLWRRAAGDLEVALVLREGRWRLPRVVVREGEDRRDAARRAARELCGWQAIDDAFVGERQESVEEHELSTWWWRVLPVERDPAFDAAAWTTWLPVGDALQRLAEPDDREVLAAARPPRAAARWRRRAGRRLHALAVELGVARHTYLDPGARDALTRAEEHLARLDLDAASRDLARARRREAIAGDAEEREAWRARLERAARAWPPGPWCLAFESALPLPSEGAPDEEQLARLLDAFDAGSRAVSQERRRRVAGAAALGAVAALGTALALGASGWALVAAPLGLAAGVTLALTWPAGRSSRNESGQTSHFDLAGDPRRP